MRWTGSAKASPFSPPRSPGGAKLAASYGALSADHIEYLDEPGVRAMADAGTVAVILPGAFYTLRETQQPPLDLLRRR